MTQCCLFSQKKFIDSEGNIDSERLILAEEKLRSQCRIEEKFIPYSRECRCDCHKDGKHIMH